MTVFPSVRGSGETASPSGVRTMIVPPSAEIPAGAFTLIMSLLTISISVTSTSPGNTTDVASAKPEPLMVIGCPATTLVGKNTLMCRPTSAVPKSSLTAQPVKATVRATVSKAPKNLNIFFIIKFLKNRHEYYHSGFCPSFGFFLTSV